VQIDRVFEEDERLLQFFDRRASARRDRHPGVGRSLPGTITAKMNGRSVVMGTQVAARIWVNRRGGEGSPERRRGRAAGASPPATA
jgi:hypothetical protein